LKKEETKKFPFRMDFVIESPELVDEVDNKALIRFQLVPDPRVWERTTKDGEEGYTNKSHDTFVPMSVLAKMTEQLPGLPITYNPPPGFSGVRKYLKKSAKRLGKDAKKKQH
jgi:hypothetical protein